MFNYPQPKPSGLCRKNLIGPSFFHLCQCCWTGLPQPAEKRERPAAGLIPTSAPCRTDRTGARRKPGCCRNCRNQGIWSWDLLSERFHFSENSSLKQQKARQKSLLTGFHLPSHVVLWFEGAFIVRLRLEPLNGITAALWSIFGNHSAGLFE